METVKDSIANVTTIGGASAVMFEFNDVLTLVLLLTGIVLNVQRIMANKKKDQSND